MVADTSLNALMRIHSELLFTFDERGRMQAINEPDGGLAPLLFYGRTTEGALWRFSARLPDELCEQFDALLTHLASDDCCEGPSRHSNALQKILWKHYSLVRLEEGPAWYLPEMPAFSELLATDGLISIEQHNLDLLPEEYSETRTYLAERQPCIIMQEKKQLASICMSSRSNSVACEAGLQTYESFRRRGYATAVTRAWASGVQASGRLALYSTSWQNLASQGVARRLGAVCYGADLSIYAVTKGF